MHQVEHTARLGVNIDHVATVRQARRTFYPDPTEIALLAEQAGADYITLHLREDRRHIQEIDVWQMRERLQTAVNLEMAITPEMLHLARQVKPLAVCLVPEKRQELTTEGGLDVVKQMAVIAPACEQLMQAGIEVSLFIDPDRAQIDASKQIGVPVIELHTGQYANAKQTQQRDYLASLTNAITYATAAGFMVNAGHGLNYANITPLVQFGGIRDFNIGHAIIARSLYVGIAQAVKEMKQLLGSTNVPVE